MRVRKSANFSVDNTATNIGSKKSLATSLAKEYSRILCLCDGSDHADLHTTAACADSAPGVTEAARRAGLSIGSPQCSWGGWAVKGEAPKCQGEVHSEENPGGADRREDRKDGKRPRKSRIGRRPEFLGEEQSGVDTLTVPTLGRRPLAPGSTRLGPATLQEKRGQARYGV
ncbi:hypothetical protein NDU88_003611 [Pleurodeles waltl]|uniref:Uncharacterized protein n=1 Tax=Pleurodeles waltl TaxID=8319 RepID=A0AAV7NJW6_PLEWA|nr:hypothetical protein NDU88_003611 [Pleurodeles waltl]